ncbi:carboxylesterase family domain-containing protein [Phthorimaea operculella]|nr:carboxylesterase family domain-containing protein [Phthorimaea operculella]
MSSRGAPHEECHDILLINSRMSALDINKMDKEEENKTPDKKQIEAEEKEVMLKSENEPAEAPAELKADGEGPVKAALSGDVTEQGREVKPKFIPIGAIKMPGFFTRNSAEKEKSKEDEAANEKDGDGEKEEKPRRHRLQFLHTCPFTQFMHHPQNENGEGTQRRRLNLPKLQNLKYPKMFQRRSTKDPEAALASMETLEDKLDTPNDGMENVKLDTGEPEDGKVATKLPLKERIRQKKFIIDDIIVCCVVLLVLLIVIIGIAVGARAGPPAERPLRLGKYMTTITTCGPAEGIRDEGVYKFYSIPYAVPPIGDRRFTYARALNNISLCWNDTLPVHTPGPLCLQFLENGTITGEEDCLTLDVVTPHVRYDSPLPVVVLIGANSLWGGISVAQPSAMYARTKEVVFVRPNFRLGPFGFLALDILSKTKYPETSGNYALSDLLVALEWVKHNIQHFGGDPRSVTLLGHRAGATLTAALTTMRRAQSLYARAWLASPSVMLPTEPLEKAQQYFDTFKQIIKCEDAECLRRKSTTEILSTTPDVWMTNNIGNLPLEGENNHSWLVLDGDLLRLPANDSWLEQKKAKEEGKEKVFRPMILGTTQHSGHSELLRKKQLNWTAEIVEQLVNDSAIGKKGAADAVWAHVNKTYAGLAELIGAVRTLCPLAGVARGLLSAPLYVAILGTFDSEVSEQRRFMAAMQQLFYYYAWHGQLAGPQSPLLAVGQDLLPLADLPLCKALADKGLVPEFAHRD